MQIGFIGSGNMARAIALGLGKPALFSDGGSGRSVELAQLVSGRAVSTAEAGSESDLLVLCHKPAQLASVAETVGRFDGTVVSVLAATTLEQLRASYPRAQVVRSMPNVAVEFGSGVIAVAGEGDNPATAIELLKTLGKVVELPETEIGLATAIGGCAPAFFARFAAALIEAAVSRGMQADVAKTIVGDSLRGSGDLLAANGVDTAAAIAAVASPGGLTERALGSFDESELEAAVDRAVATVLGETS